MTKGAAVGAAVGYTVPEVGPGVLFVGPDAGAGVLELAAAVCLLQS